MQDPVTRAYSAYKMSQKMECRMQNKTNPELPCKFPSFAEVVVAESAARKTKNCLFDEPVRSFLKVLPMCCYHTYIPVIDSSVDVLPDVCDRFSDAHFAEILRTDQKLGHSVPSSPITV